MHMRDLQREIRIKQALVLEHRQLLAAQTAALQERALRALATPQALLAGFGTGFAAALLLSRRRHAPPTTEAAKPSWLQQLLLRDVIMPIAMGMLQSKLGGGGQPEQQQEPPL